MSNFKFPIIFGSIALVAVAATIIILMSGGSAYGLSISDAYGAVSISNSSGNTPSVSSGTMLSEGDIVTVGEGANCTLVYKGKKNSENNYIVLSENTQIVINDKFTGNKNGQIFLNRGSMICNLKDKDKGQIEVRTADSLISPAKTVTKIKYSDQNEIYTDVLSFSGNPKIQLYDSMGEKVNSVEYVAEKKTGRVTTNDLGPVFVYLNIDFELSSLTAFDLKCLLTISSLLTDFPYTTAELKEAYDNAPDANEVLDIPDEPAVTDEPDDIQTAEPIETTAPDNSMHVIQPESTTAHTLPPETTKTTTAPPATTAGTTTTKSNNNNNNSNMYTVIIMIDGDESIQEVRHGDSAEKPADPVVPGLKFKGWDNSFDNITKDTVIVAIFTEDPNYTGSETNNDPSNDYTHTVTFIIADKQTSVTVFDGEAAQAPATSSIEGYTFLGWDKDFSYVTADMTVNALLQPNEYIVNFVIDGYYYPVTVKHGQSAVAPFTPASDSQGNLFLGWDKVFTSVTSNMTITAQFGTNNKEYTVTFIVDGSSYSVKVKSGEAAVPVTIPTSNSFGQRFVGWDKSIYNITADTTITAIFE